MAAAPTKPCTVCSAVSSKYKCPRCSNGSTCSLECSKKHKAEQHRDGPSSKGSGEGSDASMPSAPQLRVTHSSEAVPALASHRFTNIGRYVPMNQYNDMTMLEDFEYLQHVGKSISAAGSDIVKRGWMREEPQLPNSSNSHIVRGQLPARRKPQTQQERNRQSFESCIRKLRLPILLLPDGMSARKENTSRWKAQSRQLLTTVEIDFWKWQSDRVSRARMLPATAMHHLVPWTRKIADLVWSEISKQASLKKNLPEQRALDRDEHLHSTLADLANVDVCRDNQQSPREYFEEKFCLVVPVNPDKLRNEASNKFLEWWQRQVQHGMVKEGGLELDEQKRHAYERERQARWGRQNDNLESNGAFAKHDTSQDHSTAATDPISTAVAASIPEAAPASLISSNLLVRLQAAWQAPQQVDPQDLNAQAEAQDTMREGLEQAMANATSQSGRCIALLQGSETIESVLKDLPKGYAIVEYPRIEVWTCEQLALQRKNGRLTVLELNTAEGAEAATRTPRGTKRPHEEVQDGADSVDIINPPRKSAVYNAREPAPREHEAGLALAGLSAYASSDEDGDTSQGAQDAVESEVDDDDDDVEKSNVPSRNTGLADLARKLLSTPDRASEEKV